MGLHPSCVYVVGTVAGKVGRSLVFSELQAVYLQKEVEVHIKSLVRCSRKSGRPRPVSRFKITRNGF